MKKMTFITIFFLITAVLPARDFFGAIALNPQTGATVYSYDHYSEDDAISAAELYCNGNCVVPVVFWNTCAAVAWSPTTLSYGWAYSRDVSYAERRALNECQDYDCRIVSSICTSYYY